jgi:hypothetical protein
LGFLSLFHKKNRCFILRILTEENYAEYLHKKKAKESSVHRNPYETHDAYDAIRTQDADLAVRKYASGLLSHDYHSILPFFVSNKL